MNGGISNNPSYKKQTDCRHRTFRCNRREIEILLVNAEVTVGIEQRDAENDYDATSHQFLDPNTITRKHRKHP